MAKNDQFVEALKKTIKYLLQGVGQITSKVVSVPVLCETLWNHVFHLIEPQRVYWNVDCSLKQIMSFVFVDYISDI